MNIKQIRYFVSTIERGSLSAAAKEHYVTVQTLSKTMGDLEKELGESLFIRKSHGLEPTLFGSAFYQKSKTTLVEFDKLEAFKKEASQEVTLAASETLRLAMIAPKFYHYGSACNKIAAFVKRFMKIEKAVSLATASEGLNGLRVGRFDALMTLGPLQNEEINCVAVGTVPLGVLMSVAHPLKNVDEVTLADLQRYPLLTSGGFDLINDDFVAALRKKGLDVTRGHVTLIDVMRFIVKDQGLIFAAGIPSLGGMLSGTKLKLVSPQDAYPIPFCLTSLKGCMNPAYFAFEHFMSNGLSALMKEALS